VPEARPDSTTPVRVSFPRRVWAAFVLFALLQFAVLGTQILLQEDQRSTTDAQLRTAVRQANAALPLIEDAQPLVEDLARAKPQVVDLGRDVKVLAEELTPLTKELRDARADEQLEAAGALARTLLRADVGTTTRAVRALAANLLRADLPRVAAQLPDLVSDVDTLTDEFTRQRRLRRLLVRANGLFGEARERNLVAKATRAAEVTSTGFPRTLRLQEELLATQKEALAVIKETLAVAKEAERHAESLDRKTGGSAFPSPAGGTTRP
jgi:hypothetical protein